MANRKKTWRATSKLISPLKWLVCCQSDAAQSVTNFFVDLQVKPYDTHRSHVKCVHLQGSQMNLSGNQRFWRLRLSKVKQLKTKLYEVKQLKISSSHNVRKYYQIWSASARPPDHATSALRGAQQTSKYIAFLPQPHFPNVGPFSNRIEPLCCSACPFIVD